MAVVDSITTGASFIFTAQLTKSGVTFDIPVGATVCAAIVDPNGPDTPSIALSSAYVGADWPTSLLVGEFDGAQTALLTVGRIVDLQISIDDGTTTDAIVKTFKGAYDVIEGVVSC